MSFDDVIVKRPYACPICGESFAKWSMCQNHMNSSVGCSEGIGDETLRNQEELQELCRQAANGEYPLLKTLQFAEYAEFLQPVPPLSNFDPNAMSFDPNALSFDPKAVGAMGAMNGTMSFDPEAVAFDPKQVTFDPNAMSFEPGGYDPNVTYDGYPNLYDQSNLVPPPPPPPPAMGIALTSLVPTPPAPAPKPPVGLALTSLVPAPVPMPVGPVRPQENVAGNYQWQASSDKLLNKFEKKISGNKTEKITIDDWMPSKLDEHVRLRLHYACSTGYLLKEEQGALQKTLHSLVAYVPEEQRLVIQKFLSPSFDDFRGIVNKLFWLQRCMDYCRSSSTRSDRVTPDSPQEKLLAALDVHGLREGSLSDECWSSFEMFPPALQDMVVQAVEASLPMKTEKNLSQHFAHLAVNEESIYNLQAREQHDPIPENQEPWDAFSDSQYHEVLRHMLINSRNSEEKVLQLLAEEAPGTKANPSLLHVHLATTDARRGRSAEVISLLHSASACGLSRLCARFIAEGLDVNERTGHQYFSPLHLAASNGNVRVTETLLAHGAYPWTLDDSGKTPLYHVVTSLPESSEAEQQLLIQICQQLVFGMLQASDDDELLLVESALEILQQSELSWLLQLQYRMRELQLKNSQVFTPKMLVELGRMHYETLNLLLCFFDGDRCNMNVPEEALAIEFAAAMRSEFIQEHQQLRRKVNILAKVLDLSKPVINQLAAMPLQAAEYAMKCFQLEERAPGVYAALLPEDKEGDGQTIVEEIPRHLNVREDQRRSTGILAKWDSERGFGFIHEEDDTSEEPTAIFVHRTNLMGCTPGHPVDCQQGRRISFIPGFQDGRARAMNAAMIDAEYNVDYVHLKRPRKNKGNEVLKEKKLARIRDDIEREEHPLSKSFLQYLASAEIQTYVQEKRQEGEAWLRTLGLLQKGPGRRDDAVWRKEVDRRMEIFLEKTATPMTKKDLDFRCKRFLMEYCMKYTVVRVSEALAMVEKSLVGKPREEVRSWPAYVATLLKRFDPSITLEGKPKVKAEPKKGGKNEKKEEEKQEEDYGILDEDWKEESGEDSSSEPNEPNEPNGGPGGPRFGRGPSAANESFAFQ